MNTTAQTATRPARFRFADLTLDLGLRCVTRDGQALRLSKLTYELLVALVEAAPNVVTHDQLVERVWSSRLTAPETIAQRVKLLRRALSDDAGHPRYVEGLRGQGYRLIPEVRPWPAAPLHEASETTERSAAYDRPAPGGVTERRVAGPTVRFGGMLAAVVAFAFTAYALVRFVPDPSHDAQAIAPATEQAPLPSAKESIAVLPFVDLSENGDQAYLSAGIAEELSTLLTEIPELRVPAATSASALRARAVTIPEIARILDVEHVLEGSLRRAGSQLRIAVSLIDTQTDTRVWSKTYEASMGDVFAIQDEVASAVVEQLQLDLLAPLPTLDRPTNPEAYALYLRGRHVNQAVLLESLPLAREWLERSIELDPNNVRARSELARTYNLLADQVPDSLSHDDRVRLVRKTIDDAAAIWPDDAEVNAWVGALASNQAFHDWDPDLDLAEAQPYFEQALSADPSNRFALLAALPYAITLQRLETAIAMGKYLLDREPTCLACSRYLIRAYYLDGQYEKVEDVYRTALAMSPDLTSFHVSDIEGNFGQSLLMRGQAEAALDIFEAKEYDWPFKPSIVAGTAMALHRLKREEEFEAAFDWLLAELEEERAWLAENDYVPNFAVFGWETPIAAAAKVYIWTGDTDSAFDALSLYPWFPPDGFDDPILSVMRDHPRWPELEAKAWYPPDARDEIRFEVSLPE